MNTKLVFGVLLVGIAAGGAFADTANVVTKVNRVLIDDTNYAGCLIRVDAFLSDKLATCPGQYATMDCSGELGTSKSVSSQKLAQGQLALATGNTVRIQIDDTRKANNYCLVKFIDVLNTQ